MRQAASSPEQQTVEEHKRLCSQ